MKKFNGYEEVQVNTGFAPRLRLGGHFCKILAVNIEEITSKTTGQKYEQLVIKYDIAAPDDQEKFFSDKFSEDAKTDDLKAKYKGVHRISIPEDNSEDFIKSNFKAFTTSIEESNPGYVWNWEENTLVGKEFGAIFGLEEFKNQEGLVLTSTKIRFIRSKNSVRNAKIPKVRLLDKTYMDYQEYIEMKKQNKENSNENSSKESTISDDELPF